MPPGDTGSKVADRFPPDPEKQALPTMLPHVVPSNIPMLGFEIPPVIEISSTVEVATNRYHTSANGVQPTSEEPPSVAPLLFKQKVFVTVVVLGHAGGVESVPILHAPEQSLGAGEAQAGVVPLHGGGAPQAAHEMVALHPLAVTVPSDVNLKVRHPPAAVEVTVPGDVEPVNGLPIICGEPVLGPL